MSKKVTSNTPINKSEKLKNDLLEEFFLDLLASLEKQAKKKEWWVNITYPRYNFNKDCIE